MAFDPTKYKVPVARPLPIVLLLDVSGSMSGDKIEKLYDAVIEMVKSFADEAIRETVINVSIITFGSKVELHTPYTSVTELQKKGVTRFIENGCTPLGVALTMAKDMIDDKSVTSSKAYRPAVVLVSDGVPTDEWKKPLKSFINEGRSSKCQRFAIPIGSDADKNMLEQFTCDPNNVFYAEKAADIVNAFKKVTMSVSMRSKSVNPNSIPTLKEDFDKPKEDTSDDDDYF